MNIKIIYMCEFINNYQIGQIMGGKLLFAYDNCRMRTVGSVVGHINL